MSAKAFADALDDVAARRLGGGSASNVRRLSGGANMESWSFDVAGAGYVLRRLPSDMTEQQVTADGSLSLEQQADLIQAARAAGVRAPEVVARLEPTDDLGTGFVMTRVEGETRPRRILRTLDDPAAQRLVRDCARELARTHTIDPRACPDGLPQQTPDAMVRGLRARFAELGGSSPVLLLAFGWLARHAPEPTTPRVLHGDFRLGNLIVGPAGLTAVLDWELAHLGDPVQDLAYLCTPSWRFGAYEQPVGGFGQIEELLGAYEDHGGDAVDREHFGFWLLYSCLWWGVTCLTMTEIWRTGADRSLERPVVGRRLSEVQIDLLLLLEDRLALPAATTTDPESPLASPSGEPSVTELLTAVREWVEGAILPASEGHRAFEAHVAVNALGIAERDVARTWWRTSRVVERLRALGHDDASLGHALETAGLDPEQPELRDHLRLTALEDCAVDQPHYAGLEVARSRWCHDHQEEP